MTDAPSTCHQVTPARHRPRHGFTLVELLVVISIIALLVSLLLPALGRAKVAVRIVGCSSNVRQIAVALHGYANDWKASLPFKTIASGSQSAQWRRAWWMVRIAPYYGHDPATVSELGTDSNAVDKRIPGLLCPETGDWPETKGMMGSINSSYMPQNGRSYSMNTLLAVGRPYMGQTKQRRTLARLHASHGLVVLAGESWLYGPDKWREFSSSAMVNESTPLTGFQARRHPGGIINFAFVDGHVVPLKYGQRSDVMMGDHEELGWDLIRSPYP